jgi:hypothetical protein
MVLNAEVINFFEPADFAQGDFLGDDPAIQDLSPNERVYISAWRHGCPMPDGVIEYYGQKWLDNQRKLGDESEYSEAEIEAQGIALTRRRYDECNFVYNTVIRDAVFRAMEQGENKRDLYVQLFGLEDRAEDEPLGYAEPGRVPELATEVRPPLSRLVGYALPRVLIEQFGWGFGVERNPERYLQGLDLLDRAVAQANTPEELLAILGNQVVRADAEAGIVIGHMLAPGIEDEQNNHAEFARVRAAIRKHSPTLRNLMNKLEEA